jgi:LysR family transcriptional regulator, positive regulator for ilvC
MDIRSLELYLHLCDSLHFGRTAEQMHLSPSTLSRTLQRLELEAGTLLFERDNRSVSLTPAGVEFRRFAEQTLGNWQELRTRIDPRQDVLRGQLTLYCSVTAAYSHLPALLERFRRRHPQVEIVLSTGDAANAVAQVQQHNADIAIAVQPDPLPANLHFARVDTVPLAIIAPTMHCQVQQLVSREDIDWERVPFIVPATGPGRKRVDNWFKQMGLTADIYAQVSGHEALVSMVALGCGIGISPEVVLQHSPVRDRIQMLASPVAIAPFELGCCCRLKRRDEPLIRAFLAVI